MKKIFVHADLLKVLNDIVQGNDNRVTKIARLLVQSATDGVEEDILIEDMSNYFAFSQETKKSISYAHKEKLVNKLKELNGIEEVSDELLDDYNEEFYNNITPKFVTRTKCKPSKFITRLFTKEYRKENFSERDVEYFVNQYNGIIRNELDFVVIQGEDIRKYYNTNNYDHNGPTGTLLNSCMAAEHKQKFLDIYTKNDNVSMLVAKNGEDKVLGRALIWDDVSFKEKDSMVEVYKGKFMDRIYYTHDWLLSKFTQWAKERKIYTKNNQRHDDPFRVINPENGNVEEYYLEAEVDLCHQYLPYMDTFSIPNYKRGFITNKKFDYDENLLMRSHDQGIPSIVWDSIDGKPIRSRDSKWGEHSNSWVHRDDNIRVSGDNFHKKLCKEDRLGGHITPKDTEINCIITGDAFAERNMVTSEHHNGMIHKKEAVETIDAGVVHKNESVESKYLGSKLSKDGSIHMEKLDDYLPKSVLENGLGIEEFEKVIETLNTLKGEKASNGNFNESSTFIFEF
ncbi:MAG: hypothetical protein SLAVMIC_00409 [uncultured marine phage]|uniref:Uncharacterized protein n=1 Tax=uncultured marine phage TaxID=707152 RepID=A0A8D9C8W0_9VIRU|nr:MAG: hypothetical protein SLAVMIC_00409 [uncultured marine phage]